MSSRPPDASGDGSTRDLADSATAARKEPSSPITWASAAAPSFARLAGLTPDQTLALFGAFYRDDVLGHPDGSDHQNIRNFIKDGWDGIRFEGDALTPV